MSKNAFKQSLQDISLEANERTDFGKPLTEKLNKQSLPARNTGFPRLLLWFCVGGLMMIIVLGWYFTEQRLFLPQGFLISERNMFQGILKTFREDTKTLWQKQPKIIEDPAEKATATIAP